MPSRIPQLEKPAQLDEAQHAVFARIASGARGEVGGPFTILLHSPELASCVEQLGVFVRYGCSVPKRLRELAILVIGSFWQADYEWFAHAPIALAEGVSPDVLQAVGERREPVFAEDADRVVHDFVRQLVATGRVSDEVFAPALTLLGQAGIVELVGLVGHYSLMAFQLNAFEVPVPAGGPAIPWR